MTPPLQSVVLPNGIRLPYVEQGDPLGVPVVLLHGFPDSCRSFDLVLPHLPSSLHVFALTQRGHGDADHPPTGYRTRDFAGDVAAFMTALGLESAVLVGHSMGCTNSLRFAIDHPARTRALALLGAVAAYRGNPVIMDLWESAVSTLTDPVDPAFVRAFQESTFARPVPPAFFEVALHESLKVPAHVWRGVFQGFLEDDFASELDRVEAPTLVVWGDRDGLCPRRDQDTILSTIRGSRLLVYEGTGHDPPWEEPERFAADLVAFIERST